MVNRKFSWIFVYNIVVSNCRIKNYKIKVVENSLCKEKSFYKFSVRYTIKTTCASFSKMAAAGQGLRHHKHGFNFTPSFSWHLKTKITSSDKCNPKCQFSMDYRYIHYVAKFLTKQAKLQVIIPTFSQQLFKFIYLPSFGMLFISSLQVFYQRLIFNSNYVNKHTVIIHK